MNQIEEQSSSEELVADEPVSEPETTEQEETCEESKVRQYSWQLNSKCRNKIPSRHTSKSYK